MLLKPAPARPYAVVRTYQTRERLSLDFRQSGGGRIDRQTVEDVLCEVVQARDGIEVDRRRPNPEGERALMRSGAERELDERWSR